MCRSIRTAFRTVGLLLAASVALAAAPPGLIHYQGVLRDASDAPLSGSYDMVFRLYDAPAGGQEILVDSHTSGSGGQVVVSGGLFSAEIGGGDVTDGAGPGTYGSLSDVFRDHASVYLEVEVAGETLLPRTRVLASAYALNADRLDGVDAADLAPVVHAHDGSDITTGTISNNRLDTGPGNGLDADTVDGMHAADFVPAASNAGLLHNVVRQGGTLNWQAASQVALKPGILGFSDGKVRQSTAVLVWDFANGVGELGLDTGIEAANTWYYMYAIPDSGDDDTFSAIASTSKPIEAGGAGPLDYAVHRYMGAFRNDGSSNIRRFYVLDRNRFQYGSSVAEEIFAGPTPVSQGPDFRNLSAFVPETAAAVALWEYHHGLDAWWLAYVDAGGSPAPFLFINHSGSGSVPTFSDGGEYLVPTPTSPKGYWRQWIVATWRNVYVSGWVDEYLDY
jgi:hypothetical protein